MRDLKCGLRDCKHNKSYCCCADKIEITHSTDCATYERTGEKKSNLLFESSEELGADYSHNTNVHCIAPCLFARKNQCIANGITVLSEKQGEALCATFIKQ